MTDLARRFSRNPILAPADLKPMRPDFEVACVLNPGAFEYRGRIGLLLRVAERPVQREGYISTPVFNAATGELDVREFRLDDPKLACSDCRTFSYDGQFYLTTLSTLLPAWSDDGGRTFVPDYSARIVPRHAREAYGLEDARVQRIGEVYYITCTLVSAMGVAGGCLTTRDWRHYESSELILPPMDKDIAIFPERIGGLYRMLHRPSDPACGNHIYLGDSPDLRYWGNHRCVAMSRPGRWDGERIGAGAAPFRTGAGWLEIYHGADSRGHYALGAMLLDPEDPARVLARSVEPIMVPEADFEKEGFYGNCIFSNGQIVRGDEILLYYGASDSVVGGAVLSVRQILDSLNG